MVPCSIKINHKFKKLFPKWSVIELNKERGMRFKSKDFVFWNYFHLRRMNHLGLHL